MVFQKALSVFTLVVFVYHIVDSKKIRISEDVKPKRDYRPSKWIANSALDVWYGNRSVVDVFSRELTDIISKIALRTARNIIDDKRYSNRTNEEFIKANVIEEANNITGVNNALLNLAI